MKLYGFTEAQFTTAERHFARAGDIVREPVGVRPASFSYPGVLRVMIIEPGYPVYSPRTKRKVAAFRLDLDNETLTVEMSGDDLFGDLIVTVDGVEFRANCQSTTDELRAIFNPRFCRITAFPGMWEFAFVGSAPAMSVRPYIPSMESLLYQGGAIVIPEAWVSVTDSAGNLETIDLRDGMPFLDGEVKPGARAFALYSNQTAWTVSEWQCRPFRFRPV